MKLLKKSEIATAQAADKNREVQEGLKITRKVDSLRELLQTEEEALNKFRHETLASISQETSIAQTKKDQLLEEIKVLRTEKELGLKDVEERKTELDSFSVRLNESEKKLLEQSHNLDIKTNEIQTNLKESQSELERVRSHREETQNLHREADEKNFKATKALSQAQIELDTSLAHKAKTEQFVVEANRNLDDKRQELRAKEEELNKREISLTTLSVQLNDQRSTIEREIKRNGTSVKRLK